MVFLFQAEDGIRDIGVTGVQTCALPIFHTPLPAGEDLLYVESAPHRFVLRRLRADGSTAVVADLPSGGPVLASATHVAVLQLDDRQSVVEGKRVALGGRRIITKTNARDA